MNKKNIRILRNNWQIILIIGLSVLLFLIAWYLDSSKPRSGIGWADQSLYHQMTDRFRDAHLLLRNQMHYAIGYPLLGLIGSILNPHDPFMLVAISLLLGSVILCFLAVEKLLGKNWALVFSFLLLIWDGAARSFQSTIDLFPVPWNNQVLYFTYAYFLWLFVTQLKNKPSLKLILLTSIISGVAFLSREEAILFVAPTLAIFLFITKVGWKWWLLSFGIVIVCFLPQLIMKELVLGSVADSGRKLSYSQATDQYLQPSFLYRNIWETLIDSDHFINQAIERPALLQASPWLWLALPGYLIVLFTKRYPLGLKVFFISSGVLMIFYLAGVNMSGHKLAYHCLRYISPGFIAINLATIIFVKEGYIFCSKKLERIKNDVSEK